MPSSTGMGSIRSYMKKYLSMVNAGKVHGSLLVENLRREHIRLMDAPAMVRMLLSLEGKRPPFSVEEWGEAFRNNTSVAFAFANAIRNTVNLQHKKPKYSPLNKRTEEHLSKTFSLIQMAIDNGKFPWDRFYVLLRQRKIEGDPQVAVSIFGRLYDEKTRNSLAKDAAIGTYYSSPSIATALRHAAIKSLPDGGMQAREIMGSHAKGKMDRLRVLVEKAREGGKFNNEEYCKKAMDSLIEVADAGEAAGILEAIRDGGDSVADYLLYLSGLYHRLAEEITIVAVDALREEYSRR